MAWHGSSTKNVGIGRSASNKGVHVFPLIQIRKDGNGERVRTRVAKRVLCSRPSVPGRRSSDAPVVLLSRAYYSIPLPPVGCEHTHGRTALRLFFPPCHPPLPLPPLYRCHQFSLTARYPQTARSIWIQRHRDVQWNRSNVSPLHLKLYGTR